MNKKLAWIIGILVLVIVVLIAFKKTGVIGKEEGIKITAESASKKTIIETVNASGKIYPEIEVKVSPDISGEIVELNVEEGDSVRKGQVLARIYADIYNTQRDQASAGVSQMEAQVMNSTAQLGSLKATMDQAEVTYNRQKQLLDDKVISRAEFEQADQAFKTSRAQYQAALAGIRGTQASVQSARAQLSRANKDVSRATLVAPMDGIVSLLAVKKGERVVGTAQMAGTEMLRVANMDLIEVRVDVGENDIPKVHLGDSAIVEVDAYNKKKFKGLVTKIASSNTSAALSQSGGTTDVTNYKVHIRLLPESYADLLVNRKGRAFPFRPGMNASADIQTKTHPSALSVPINAVTTRDKNSDKKDSKEKEGGPSDNKDNNTGSDDDIEEVVFIVQKDMTVKKVKVRTDIQDINNIEILGGLKEGDMVVTGPYSVVSKTLKEGDKVKVVPKENVFDEKKD
ncbi:efflux RND transporter periplasmic adaptor subunit [Segetibacter sp. 3557_3]|uniref:efflux RND transporter periplasmic adaptor subunit n=1 Tax=Segetibacter sp. 3557_3 TaxID=2547429 RepID=UPI001058C875|nr:efflux RND transporter periplasmic adaptor subunit [Segetibacter sp. 3557_3]TDH19798.1 efflux RND transporter periplasmic adaptor subunit [Segetibacter sp. 3557_3]